MNESAIDLVTAVADQLCNGPGHGSVVSNTDDGLLTFGNGLSSGYGGSSGGSYDPATRKRFHEAYDRYAKVMQSQDRAFQQHMQMQITMKMKILFATLMRVTS